MVRHKLGWLLLAAACVPGFFTACSGSESNGGGAGTGGATTGIGGGSASTGGGVATGGAPGTGGAAPGAGGMALNDAGRIPCGDAGTCNPNNQNARMCDIANQRCVECLTAADCVGDPQGTVCNTMQGRCRACIVGSTAAGETCPAGQACTGNGNCVPTCATDADCAVNAAGDAGGNGNIACNTAATPRVCVECTTNAHCATQMGQPVCNVANNNCVECLTNADCAAVAGQPICDMTNANNPTCEACVVDADCAGTPATPFCRTQGNNTCVQCRTLADCPAGATACPMNGGQAG